MPGLAELIYTTSGGIVGSLITIAVSQSKDRRAARAGCSTHLHQLRNFNAAFGMLDDMRRDFEETLAVWESTALAAGLPRKLVTLCIATREWHFYVWSARQHRWGEEFDDGYWDGLTSELGGLVLALEKELKMTLWHP